nr:MAG TPA: tail protein [Caudoviricetes sp.]
MADLSCRERMYSRMRSLRLYNLEEGSLIRAELDSYLDVLEPLQQKILAVQQDALVQTCSEDRLMAFERMLAIPVNQNIPLQERRQMAVSKMSIGPSDFHRTGIEKALNAIGVSATVEEEPGGGTITVTATGLADSQMTLDQAKQAFEALMPAHLLAEFVTGGISFAEFDSLDKTFTQLDEMDKSWSQLEMMSKAQWEEE